MKNAQPYAVAAPSVLVLAAAAAMLWFNAGGLRGRLSGRLFALWEQMAHAGAVRPAYALPAEILALLVLGGAIILLMLRVRLYWAGLFTAALVGCGFEISWLLFYSGHWRIDAATPSLGLVLVLLTGVLSRTTEVQLLRTKLRIAFSDSLPRATIEKIARRPDLLSIEGETRTVTYLVCGVRRLAGLAAEYRDDPKGFTKLMNDVLSPMLDQVMAHGGTIDRLTADGFAAFWNAPLDDADHALHACEAANGMAVMAARVNETINTMRTPADKVIAPLEIGIGIATGPVIAGGFGGHGRLGYSVNGDAAMLAVRIQALSPLYGPAVIVADETMRAAERNFAFLEVDYIAAGGEDVPVRLYAMLGNPVARSSPKFRALSTFHEHIFNSLRTQQWGKARELIEQCRKLSGASQSLYDLHLRRIKYFESNPPGPDWDGAFRPS